MDSFCLLNVKLKIRDVTVQTKPQSIVEPTFVVFRNTAIQKHLAKVLFRIHILYVLCIKNHTASLKYKPLSEGHATMVRHKTGMKHQQANTHFV